IDCEWSKWGSWSACYSCSPERSRFRNVSVAAMFNGEDCSGSDYQIDRGCPAAKPCTTTCPEGYFSCADGLTCVKPQLVCNGDNDCTDNSDEHNCKSGISSPCASNEKYSVIPSIGLAGAGFDITEGRIAGEILDNHQYNGHCDIAHSGDHNQVKVDSSFSTRSYNSAKEYVFRKPANVQYYGFQVNVDSSFSTSAYNSAEQYVEEEKRRTDDKINTGSSVGCKVSVQSSFTKNSNMRKIVKQSSNKDAKFFRVSSTVKLAQFSIVRGNYILSHNFRRRLRNLPEHYDYLKYLQVIIDFGTHFCSAGTLGGKYEYIYRYSKSQLEKSKLSDSEQRHCLSMEASVKFFGSGVSGGSTSCSSNALSQSHGSSFTKSAEDVISNVIGGYSGKAASLSFSNDPNDNDYDAWVETVKHNPSIIDYEITPMSAVITNPTKRRNMERALYLYMAKYDVVACKGKCYNGAAKIVTDNGKTCTCLCKFPYTGVDCHNETGNLNKPFNGQWVSSWGSWSSCSRSCYPGGTRYRTRYVTRYPKNGGSGCPGLTWTTGC
uniref:MACPF domain-containing protein n=1 Tax=Ciona intestinalis TaxID=7719 RepID=F6R7P6_CIOIN